MDALIEVKKIDSAILSKGLKAPYYFILIFDSSASFAVDFTHYQCEGKTILFLSPYQVLEWHHSTVRLINSIRFHGDFYCIEYHKKEVACNGILFNNIYQQPYVTVGSKVFEEMAAIINRMQDLSGGDSDYDLSVVKTYLQLILALSSREKQLQPKATALKPSQLDNILNFQAILENHFSETKEVGFYAEKFALSINTFSKKIKKHFGKSPSKLIQERIVLESKKLLHLTYKPVKEIAIELNFKDEFYFSRYFKKEVGVSPKQFREKVGISIAAK